MFNRFGSETNTRGHGQLCGMMSLIAILALMGVTLSAPVMAQTAGVEWSGTEVITSGGPWDMGYSFDVTDTFSVTALGAYDAGGDGLVNPHVVGLFTSGGTLLASVTVQSSDPLVGHFRYHGLTTPQVLSPGSYVILSMVWGGEGQDPWGATEDGPNVLSFAPGIANLVRAYRSSTGSLNLAGIDVGCCSSSGYFGANILTGDLIVTPELPVPVLNRYTTLTLVLLTALLGLAALRSYRRQH